MVRLDRQHCARLCSTHTIITFAASYARACFLTGQSNMEDPMLTQINSTEECERANSFPTIRLFTVNDGVCAALSYSCGVLTAKSFWHHSSHSQCCVM